MRIPILPILYHRGFSDGFECIVDYTGFIFIKFPNENNWTEQCMKACYDVIKTRSIAVAESVLALSCEIQNDPEITERACLY